MPKFGVHNWTVFVTAQETWDLRRRIFVGDRDTGVMMEAATLKRYEQSDIVDTAFFEGDSVQIRALMQAFMDAAWQMGLKPAAYEEPKNELAATRKHLGDMRKIAGKAVGIDLGS